MGVILRRSDLSTPGPIGGTTASSGAFTTLSASSTVSGNGFTSLFASPPAIGSTTPGTGAFTTLQLNTGGPILRNNAGTIEARDATNSAAAPFNCGNINSTGAITAGSFGLDHVISGSVTVDRQNTNQLVLRNTAFNTGVRGSLLFSAIDGANGTTRGAASIQLNVQAATLNSSISAGLEFVTTDAQAFAPSTQARMRVYASGGVSIAQNSAAQVDPGTSNLRVAGNASVGSLTINGGLYVRQQAVPSSPVTGMRWDEVDGSGVPVNSWYYDATVSGGSWLTVQLFTRFFTAAGEFFVSTLSGGSQSVLGGAFAPPHPYSAILINNVTFSRFSVSSGLDATNNYQQLIQATPSQNLTVASLTINSNDAVGIGMVHASVAANSVVVRVFAAYGDWIRYLVRGNGTPPTNFQHFASLNYRGIR